ncbi:MAG: hypothetical protein PHX13_11415 [Thiovulaceae bacterium]|nr:hypothetical protein [Sulfurimonadaceae bacterium]
MQHILILFFIPFVLYANQFACQIYDDYFAGTETLSLMHPQRQKLYKIRLFYDACLRKF